MGGIYEPTALVSLAPCRGHEGWYLAVCRLSYQRAGPVRRYSVTRSSVTQYSVLGTQLLGPRVLSTDVLFLAPATVACIVKAERRITSLGSTTTPSALCRLVSAMAC